MEETMQTIIDLIKDNYEFCFSGIGASLLVLILGWFFETKRRKRVSTQKIDKNSSGIQAVGSININHQPSGNANQNKPKFEIDQTITNNSSGIQSGGDINITQSDSEWRE